MTRHRLGWASTLILALAAPLFVGFFFLVAGLCWITEQFTQEQP